MLPRNNTARVTSPLVRETIKLNGLNANANASRARSSQPLKNSDRPEAQLLLACARTTLEPMFAERIRSLVRRDLDWMYVLEKTDEHFLTPLVYRNLSAVRSADMPDEVLNELQDRANANARHNLYRTGELIKLVGLLEHHGIPVMPFKGPTLSVLAYGSLGLREYADLDILVRKRDVQRAKELLFSHGYQLASSREDQFGKDLIFESQDHHRVRVELHWELLERHYDLTLDLDGLWGQLQPITLAGSTVLTLAPEMMLLYLCMHGSRHKWERLLWVCDVAEMVRSQKEMNWASVLEQADKLGCERMLALGLLLAQELLGTKLPEEVSQKIQLHSGIVILANQLREMHFHEGQRSEGYFFAYRAHLAVRERPRDRRRLRFRYYRGYLRRAFVPNEKDRAVLALPAWLSPLYYFLRPLRLLGCFGQKD